MKLCIYVLLILCFGFAQAQEHPQKDSEKKEKPVEGYTIYGAAVDITDRGHIEKIVPPEDLVLVFDQNVFKGTPLTADQPDTGIVVVYQNEQIKLYQKRSSLPVKKSVGSNLWEYLSTKKEPAEVLLKGLDNMNAIFRHHDIQAQAGQFLKKNQEQLSKKNTEQYTFEIDGIKGSVRVIPPKYLKSQQPEFFYGLPWPGTHLLALDRVLPENRIFANQKFFNDAPTEIDSLIYRFNANNAYYVYQLQWFRIEKKKDHYVVLLMYQEYNPQENGKK